MKDQENKPLIVKDYEEIFDNPRNKIEYIQVYNDVFSRKECKNYIEFYNSNYQKAGWSYKGKVGSALIDENKKQSLDISLNDYPENIDKTKKTQPFLEIFGKRIWGYLTYYLTSTAYWGTYPYVHFLNSNEVVKLHDGFGLGCVNLRKYTKNTGGYFVPHYDNQGAGTQFRSIAIILYLNTLNYGGETIFPALDRRVRPIEGRIVIFPSNFTYLHYGNSAPEDRYIIAGHLEHDKRKDPEKLNFVTIHK